MQDIFVTGIDTEIGKTIVSAILVQALGYDYWKPVQCGSLNKTDTDIVKTLVSRKDIQFHPEQFRLHKPASINIAAKYDGVHITLDCFQTPKRKKQLVIEGAGGVLVPLNDTKCIVDLIQKLSCKVIVVTKNYLGSINHTLSTLQVLKHHGCHIIGMVVNGDRESDIESTIEKLSSIPILFHVSHEKVLNKSRIKYYAQKWNEIQISL